MKKFATIVLKRAPVALKRPDGRKAYRFVGSTAAVDRAGDVLEQTGWQLDNFHKTGGVVLWNHDYDAPIGRAVATVTPEGLVFDVEFMPAEINPFAAMVEAWVDGDWVKSTSVGFQALEYARNASGGMTAAQMELLEFSITTVPCNAEAVRKAVGTTRRVAPIYDDARLLAKVKAIDLPRAKAWLAPARRIELVKAAAPSVRLVRVKSMDPKKVAARLEAALGAMTPQDGKLDEAAFMAALKEVEASIAELKAEQPAEGETPEDPNTEPADGEGEVPPEDDAGKKPPPPAPAPAKSAKTPAPRAPTAKDVAREVAALLGPQIKQLASQTEGEGLFDGDDDEKDLDEMLASVKAAAERGVQSALAGDK